MNTDEFLRRSVQSRCSRHFSSSRTAARWPDDAAFAGEQGRRRKLVLPQAVQCLPLLDFDAFALVSDVTGPKHRQVSCSGGSLQRELARWRLHAERRMGVAFVPAMVFFEAAARRAA